MKKPHTTAALAFIGLCVLALGAWCAMPVNPNASESTKRVLNYLANLPGQTSKRVLSGQFTNHSQYATLTEIEKLKSQTGQWVGIVGGDYFSMGDNGAEPGHTAAVNSIFKEYWRLGGLTTLSEHYPNPTTSNGGVRASTSSTYLPDVYTPGAKGYTKWMQLLDLTASGLHELQSAGVVVLFRPYHEMTGSWFWWGNKNPDQFRELWKRTYVYLTSTKKLNNLIWVYSPNINVNAGTYYPGDAFVDIVGIDGYTTNLAEFKTSYDQLIGLGKPFGLTEFGSSISGDKSYDYTKLMSFLKTSMPKTVFVQTWHNKWGLQDNPSASKFLNDAWIQNRAVPWSGASLPAQNQAPSVRITAPVSGATVGVSTPVTVTVELKDDGQIESVEYYEWNNVVRTLTSAPFSMSWQKSIAGSYSIRAKAVDDQGAYTFSEPITVIVRQPSATTKPSRPDGRGLGPVTHSALSRYIGAPNAGTVDVYTSAGRLAIHAGTHQGPGLDFVPGTYIARWTEDGRAKCVEFVWPVRK